MTHAPSSPERIVVRPPNWLGDAILALPAIAAIRQAYPSAHLTVAAPASVAPLFREDTDARPDRVLDLPASTRAAILTLEGEGFSHGILLPNSFRSAWQFRRAQIPARWGYATAGRGWLLTRRSRTPKTVGVRHQADYYRDLVRGLGIACADDVVPRLAPTVPSAQRAEALLAQHAARSGSTGALTGPLVGFAPGAAYGQAKQWPPERMAEVMARLIRDHDVTCLLVGASHDAPAARAIESWLRAQAPEAATRVVNLVGRTSLGALVGVVARTLTFVSNDSGAMHLAAALGRPVVAVFGPTDERVTRPVGAHEVIIEPVFCRPCMLRDCPIDHRCMKRISVDRVYEAVVASLTRLA